MWPNPNEAADFFTFTAEILNRKPIFLCMLLFRLQPRHLCEYTYKEIKNLSFILKELSNSVDEYFDKRAILTKVSWCIFKV